MTTAPATGLSSPSTTRMGRESISCWGDLTSLSAAATETRVGVKSSRTQEARRRAGMIYSLREERIVGNSEWGGKF
jgi:hypothetical protein